MTPELWQRLKPLYNAALDQPTSARDRFVTDACGGDPELATALRKLLSAAGNSVHALDSPLPELSHLLATRSHLLPADALLADRFRIVRHLGSGGMGDVYEALDEQLEHGHIALKVIRPSIADNPAALARFKDEVRLTRKVTGPHVCRIHELYLVGATPAAPPTAFLTMELLEGITLHQRLAQGSALSPEHLKNLADQLCTALDCIHSAGIVHQDLKPGNIMLVRHNGAERAVVTDFGLARAPAKRRGREAADEGSPVAGTPSYMAPEQFEGREVSPATDIYALGIILYELATGVQPYAAHTPLAAAIRRSKPPVHASAVRADVPAAWDGVIARCLHYEPDQRFRSAAEVAAALRHRGKVAVRLGRRRRMLIPVTALTASAISLTVLLACSLWLLFGRPRHRELAPDAAHWYILGMAALREGSYLKATRLLTMVTERDPTYALAHAALADAWTELDFTETAQREMLLASAPEEQRGLNRQERRYIDAVRTTLVRDYSAAAQDYEAILQALPSDSKAQGYVDLGRIYEKAGHMPQTLASYEQAARLDHDDPAPFLHLGILRSRLRDPELAAQAFARAETLYGAQSDTEGLAETIYQRGYAANEAGRYAEAKDLLQHALTLARAIPDVTMVARAQSQLSNVADNQDNETEALTLAQQASRTAQSNDLQYWVTDSLIRAGNAWMGSEHFAEADAALREALQQARRDGHPRLEAYANLNLASLRDQEGRWDEQIRYAHSALGYYEDYSFLNAADRALALMTRGELSRGNYGGALTAAHKLLATASRAQSPQFLATGHELLGSVYGDTEQYPEALLQFQAALSIRQDLGEDLSYEQVHCADLLWRLGRYPESETTLNTVASVERKRGDVASHITESKAGALLSQQHPEQALQLVDEARRSLTVAIFNNTSLQNIAARATLELGQLKESRDLAMRAMSVAQEQQAPSRLAQTTLLYGELAFRSGDMYEAQTSADAAYAYFQKNRMWESAALALLLRAKADAFQEDARDAADDSQHALDIMNQLEHSWGTSVWQQYAKRPDRVETLRTLLTLRRGNGDPSHALFP